MTQADLRKCYYMALKLFTMTVIPGHLFWDLMTGRFSGETLLRSGIILLLCYLFATIGYLIVRRRLTE